MHLVEHEQRQMNTIIGIHQNENQLVKEVGKRRNEEKIKKKILWLTIVFVAAKYETFLCAILEVCFFHSAFFFAV